MALNICMSGSSFTTLGKLHQETQVAGMMQIPHIDYSLNVCCNVAEKTLLLFCKTLLLLTDFMSGPWVGNWACKVHMYNCVVMEKLTGSLLTITKTGRPYT